MARRPGDYDGGLSVSQELLDLLNQPGYISIEMGGQRARKIYNKGSFPLQPDRLSPFGLLCYDGHVAAIKKEIESGTTPPLDSTETPYKWGYATLTLFGYQTVDPDYPGFRHIDTLNYLISKGLDVDIPDIAGWTTLSHASMAIRPRLNVMEILLQAGANPNHQGRYGDVPLFGAFQHNHWKETDLLLEYGADLDIPDAEGTTPRKNFLHFGAQITAVVQRHIQKRAGTEAPRSTKCCDNCQKGEITLKNCSRCKVARYCSTTCQGAAWLTHKKVCQPFTVSTTVTLKPFYEEFDSTYSLASIARHRGGLTATPASPQCGSAVPKEVLAGKPKATIIKVQAPLDGKFSMLVYNKKRDFACTLRREDGESGWDQLLEVVQDKGVGQAKAYFAAEVKSKDVLVIKISEVLADQPF